MRTSILAVMLAMAGAATSFADAVQLHAMRILASNEPAPLDRRLERVDYQLRPLFRFESYRFLSDGSGVINTPGETTIALGDGHSVRVRATGDRGGVRAEVQWTRGGQTIVSTVVNLKRNRPAILGGVPDGSGTLIVTLGLQ